MINCNPTIAVGKSGGPIVMGVVGNFNARQQSFDISFWQEKLGPGQLVVALLRPGDSIPYAVSDVTISGSIATWTFSETDTAKSGYGKVFLTYSGTDFKDATTDYSCFVAKNSAPTGEVPSDLESWYQSMLDAAAAAKESATAAAGSASAAADSAAAAEAAQQHGPMIGQNGNWWIWDAETGEYTDSGSPSRGTPGPAGPQGPKGDTGGVTDAVKVALLTIAEKAGYSDEHGQDYYDALYAALYPPAELLSITASFAQGSHTVYDTDTLDSLKPYLTVTGAYDDGSSRAITDYTLSGTLTEGTSTITVSFGGKATTFTVTVTHRIPVVTGIHVDFDQGSAVIYDNASLDDLKPYLVVTASYDDGTSAAVSGYTLSGTLAAGTSTITASYSGFSDTFTVTVTERPVTLVSISAVFTQGDNVVYDTDSLDTLKQYLVVTAHYDDNTDTVVSNYTLSGTLTEGTSTITVSFGDKTTTFTVIVTHKVAQVTGISAMFSQGSTVIYDNASLDDLKPYLVVTASYDDGTSAAVSDYSLSGTLTAGTSTITVSYGGFSDTFTVTVTERPVTLISITAVFTQGQNVIYDTDSLDVLKQYLVVTAHYDDNTDTVVSDYTLSGTLAEGTSTITVSFGGKTTTFTVTVTEYDTQPVIMTEGVCWSKTAGQTVAKEGFGITKWYGYEFTQEALESCAFWDSENGYMTQNGWSGLKYYISDADTLAAGYTWPASSNFKHEIGLDGVGQSISSITKNADGTIQFARYSIPALSYNGLSFTIPLLDADDCYAYWYEPRSGSILPTGVKAGDIIFAGKNTPYYRLHNISEASGT